MESDSIRCYLPFIPSRQAIISSSARLGPRRGLRGAQNSNAGSMEDKFLCPHLEKLIWLGLGFDFRFSIKRPRIGHATLTLEDVEGIFRKANLEGKITFLREGKGHRTVKLEVFMTEAMMDSFGFNKVGTKLKP
jgi:hypothetical protein